MKFSVPVVRNVELQANPGKRAFKIRERISKIQRYRTIWGKKPALPGVAVAARSRLNQEDGVNVASFTWSSPEEEQVGMGLLQK